MARGIRWKLCNFVGGQQAVHQAYKPWLAVESGDPNPGGSDGQAAGEISIEARTTGPIVISGLGFQPGVIFLTSYRPRNHNGHTDTNFGNRGGGMTMGVAGPYQSFTGSSRIQQGFDLDSGIKRWREDVCFNVISQIPGVSSPPIDILTIELTSIDADGFTLEVTLNLYDQSNPIAWLAMEGAYQVGCMSAGDTSIGGFSGFTPSGAVFISTKSLQSDVYSAPLWDNGTAYLIGDTVEWLGTFWTATANHTGSEPPSANWDELPPKAGEPTTLHGWDHLTGFAAPNGQAGVWGGGRHSSWGWTTEYWSDSEAIVLGKGANGSFFAGAEIEALGTVTAWNDGGIDLQWPTFNNQPYRIGYVLVGNRAEQGVIETNWEKRPGGSQNSPPGSGSNFEDTTIRPYTVLMAGTNYTFDYSDTDPFDNPRSPDTFQSGGGGGIAWHVQPFSENSVDAYGVHTYANGIAELGHYQNSGTIFRRGCVADGAGANSRPPAAHQHGVNIIPSPRIPGLNYRTAERHAQVKRIHLRPDEV